MTRRVMWAGLAVVLTAAAVLSFLALRDLALAVGIPHVWSSLLPIAIDAGAAVSCAVWLTRTVPDDARAWARGMTWTLLVLTVVGNAAQLGMHAAQLVPPWWVAVLVGAVPPAVVGSTVHLAVLVGRRATAPVSVDATPDATPAPTVGTVVKEQPPPTATCDVETAATDPDDQPDTEVVPAVRIAGPRDELVAKAQKLGVAPHLIQPVVDDLATGVGRPSLLKKYETEGLTYHQAKELVTHRNRVAS